MLYAICLSCRRRYTFEHIKARVDAGEDIPDCEVCHGLLKPDAVLFGEALPRLVLMEASRRAKICDLCLVIGSTLAVYPAAYMPMYARQAGARLVIINLSETPMDGDADILIPAKAGETMSRIVTRVKQRIESRR
jgi:NAD-dependent deacetylase